MAVEEQAIAQLKHCVALLLALDQLGRVHALLEPGLLNAKGAPKLLPRFEGPVHQRLLDRILRRARREPRLPLLLELLGLLAG